MQHLVKLTHIKANAYHGPFPTKDEATRWAADNIVSYVTWETVPYTGTPNGFAPCESCGVFFPISDVNYSEELGMKVCEDCDCHEMSGGAK